MKNDRNLFQLVFLIIILRKIFDKLTLGNSWICRRQILQSKKRWRCKLTVYYSLLFSAPSDLYWGLGKTACRRCRYGRGQHRGGRHQLRRFGGQGRVQACRKFLIMISIPPFGSYSQIGNLEIRITKWFLRQGTPRLSAVAVLVLTNLWSNICICPMDVCFAA